ncbi:O-antigen ligase family protein [Microcella sp.]|uniref:O-antigen ligase family protein n=1 Tax=Microcella sp. TaxID=1913979 RepID=UPI00391CB353
MSWLRDRRVALAAVTFFTLLAGDAWRNSISWYGWGAVVVLIVAGWIAVAVEHRVDLRRIPIALGAFAGLAALSIVWSAYPSASAIGIPLTLATMLVGVVLAHTVPLDQVLRALGVALRWILGLSLAFELFVAAVLRRPVLPLWVDYDEPVPRAFYWSRALLFEGGRIQGIPGNANLLAFAALLGVIVFGIQLAERRVGRAAGWGWLGAALLTLGLTRSSTVIVCAVGAAAVLVIVLLARRYSLRGQLVVYSVATAMLAIVVAGAIAGRETLLALLGRSDDLTGRLDIWAAVIDLAQQRPVLGWGWVSYWAPWVEPFDDLAVIRGVTYLQAHNAWLDVWLQLGVVGVVVFGILVVTTGVRTLAWSVDSPRDSRETPTLRLLPVLVLTVLLVHSLAESRLLIEAGMVMLVWLAVASRSHRPAPAAPAVESRTP